MTNLTRGTAPSDRLIGAPAPSATGIVHLGIGNFHRPMYVAICALLMVLPYPAFMMLETRNVWIVGTVVVLGFILAVEGTVGVQSAFFPELFGSRYRYAGVALGRELSAAVGGFGPLLAQWLYASTRQTWPVAVFLTVMIGIGRVTALLTPETRGRDLLVEEDAHRGEPRPAV
ncbi:MFS transporter [Mariniluteicoccus flavus]